MAYEIVSIQRGWRSVLRHRVGQAHLGRRWESCWPGLAGLTAFVLTATYQSTVDWRRVVQDVVPTAVSAASILGAFQATAQSILVSMGDSPAINRFAASGHLARLHRFISAGWRSLLCFVALGLGLLAFNTSTGAEAPYPTTAKWLCSAAAGLLVFGGASTFRVMPVMLRLAAAGRSSAPRSDARS